MLRNFSSQSDISHPRVMLTQPLTLELEAAVLRSMRSGAHQWRTWWRAAASKADSHDHDTAASVPAGEAQIADRRS